MKTVHHPKHVSTRNVEIRAIRLVESTLSVMLSITKPFALVREALWAHHFHNVLKSKKSLSLDLNVLMMMNAQTTKLV
jgi:hypothetical protein